ncbi:hypothetical protein NGM37_41180, partial [Streptomyces sp. TRM76130]|nr:hypothetical protein [Streptomyces sp. TRM76130]
MTDTYTADRHTKPTYTRPTYTAETYTADAGPGVVRLAAVFLPAPLPREGRFAFWDPADDSPPAESPGVAPLTVVRRHGSRVRRRTVTALTLPVDEALPLLVRARHDPAAHPA